VHNFRFVFLKTYHPKKFRNPTLGGCTLQRSYNSHVSKHLKYGCLETYKTLVGVDEAWNFVNSITWQRHAKFLISWPQDKQKYRTSSTSNRTTSSQSPHTAGSARAAEFSPANFYGPVPLLDRIVVRHDDESQPPEIKDNQLVTSSSPCHSGFGGVIIPKIEKYKENHLRVMIRQECFSALSFSKIENETAKI